MILVASTIWNSGVPNWPGPAGESLGQAVVGDNSPAATSANASDPAMATTSLPVFGSKNLEMTA